MAAGTIVNLKSTSGAPISGIITAVSPGADSLSLKTFIRIHINDSSEEISMGDFLHGQIMLPSDNFAISIPRNAMVSRGGDLVVFVLDENNVAKEQSVKIGAEYGGKINIVEGLNVNQKIVIEGQQYLITGLTTSPYATE